MNKGKRAAEQYQCHMVMVCEVKMEDTGEGIPVHAAFVICSQS
jgi:hypothetical protein